MTFVQLRHFLSVAETGSFTRSAKALSITQPALSRSIHALEEVLGRALFDRVGRRSELSHFGREMLERARHLLQSTDESVLSVAQQVGWASGAYLTRMLGKAWATTAGELRARRPPA